MRTGGAKFRTDQIWDDHQIGSGVLRSAVFDLPVGSIVHVNVRADLHGPRGSVLLEVHRDGAWQVWQEWRTSHHDPRGAWFARAPEDATAGRLIARGPFESVSALVESES